jgi:hypothetical protein
MLDFEFLMREREVLNSKYKIRNGRKLQVSSIQFQGKTKDQETEEARSEATSSKEGHGRPARV